MAPNMETGPLLFESVEEYRASLGPTPDPCPCDFFYKGFVCDWHTDEELFRLRKAWLRANR